MEQQKSLKPLTGEILEGKQKLQNGSHKAHFVKLMHAFIHLKDDILFKLQKDNQYEVEFYYYLFNANQGSGFISRMAQHLTASRLNGIWLKITYKKILVIWIRIDELLQK